MRSSGSSARRYADTAARRRPGAMPGPERATSFWCISGRIYLQISIARSRMLECSEPPQLAQQSPPRISSQHTISKLALGVTWETRGKRSDRSVAYRLLRVQPGSRLYSIAYRIFIIPIRYQVVQAVEAPFPSSSPKQNPGSISSIGSEIGSS